MGGESGPLGANGVLGDLNDDFLTDLEHVFDSHDLARLGSLFVAVASAASVLVPSTALGLVSTVAMALGLLFGAVLALFPRGSLFSLNIGGRKAAIGRGRLGIGRRGGRGRRLRRNGRDLAGD